MRAGKTQGANAASEVSLLHLPTQVKSSMVTLEDGWREIKNRSFEVRFSGLHNALFHHLSGSRGSKYVPPAQDRSSFCWKRGWGAGLCPGAAETGSRHVTYDGNSCSKVPGVLCWAQQLGFRVTLRVNSLCEWEYLGWPVKDYLKFRAEKRCQLIFRKISMHVSRRHRSREDKRGATMGDDGFVRTE